MLLLLHLIIIALLSITFITLKAMPRRPTSPVEWTIGAYYNHILRCINTSGNIEMLNSYKAIIDGFYNKHYRDKPTIRLRRSLRRSLMESYANKYKELQAMSIHHSKI